MDLVYGSQDHDWLSVHGRLAIMEWRGRSKAREVIVIAQRERERGRERGGRRGYHQWLHLEMATQQRSTQATGGALMGRWFWARG
jgi:hypothetical protein